MPHIISNMTTPQRYFYCVQHQIKPLQDISLVRGLYRPLNYAAPLCKLSWHWKQCTLFTNLLAGLILHFLLPVPPGMEKKLSPTTSLLLVTKVKHFVLSPWASTCAASQYLRWWQSQKNEHSTVLPPKSTKRSHYMKLLQNSKVAFCFLGCWHSCER